MKGGHRTTTMDWEECSVSQSPAPEVKPLAGGDSFIWIPAGVIEN
jgi:hypothetical protein